MIGCLSLTLCTSSAFIIIIVWSLPHSPDLNPIEHIWYLLKKKILELYPQLYLRGRSKIDWRQFKQAIITAWEAIPQGMIDNLILSMPHRIQAVLHAKGWYTKY